MRSQMVLAFKIALTALLWVVVLAVALFGFVFGQ